MGTFTRTVEDAAIMLNALAGHDPQDHSTSELPVPDYHAAIGSMQSPPRIGIVRQFFFERCDSEIKSHTNEVIEKLGKAGAIVEDVELPTNFDTVLATQRTLMTVESAAFHQDVFSERADDYGPFVRAIIESGMITPAVTYVQAQRHRRQFRHEMEAVFQNFDILLTPSTTTPAPKGLSSTGDPMFQSPWTTCGIPAITIPSGLSESGLPLGIQLAAAPFDEETLLAAAHWCEGVLNVGLVPPV
jgi:Asp-tRNA(Asn)/Glu-tRNA(Gln) amidotransferase A subunit family amidase